MWCLRVFQFHHSSVFKNWSHWTPYPLVNSHGNGKWTFWRCIPYWKWGFSIAMLVYRSVTYTTQTKTEKKKNKKNKKTSFQHRSHHKLRLVNNAWQAQMANLGGSIKIFRFAPKKPWCLTPTYSWNIHQTLNHLFIVWNSFHICILGYLGYVPGFCWNFLGCLETKNFQLPLDIPLGCCLNLLARHHQDDSLKYNYILLYASAFSFILWMNCRSFKLSHVHTLYIYIKYLRVH